MLGATPTARRARLGVSLMFFTNGVILSSLLPRYPEVKAAFGLGGTGFGLLVIAFPVGAVLAAAFAGMVIRRCGTLRVTAAGSASMAAALAVAGVVAAGAGPGAAVWAFALAMVVAGALDAVVDAAQNVQGVVVEQWRSRSIMNSLHAVWSIGAATGGIVGAACAAASVDLGLQMVVGGVAWSALAVLASVLAVVPAAVRADQRVDLDPDPAVAARPRSRVPGRGLAWRLLLPLVVLATCGTLVEDVANNWVVLYLGEEAGAPAGIAALGLTVVLVAQFVGRLLGDPMTDRWGRGPVARTGGLLIAVGAAVVVLLPGYPLAFLGFALAGFGCATLVPAAYAAAGRIPGMPEGTGIAVIGWLMRLGFLVTSPVIGVWSDVAGLRSAMVVPLAAGLVAAALAHRVARAARRDPEPGRPERG